ncbi:MAG: internal scaffolding protein [Microvirus sp.]|nr:MAG: internal scaffolding protein [Microvirus sp.]
MQNDKSNNEKPKYTYEKINRRRRIQIKFDDPSLTQQQFKDEVNINNIVKRYKTTGELPEMRKPIYGDASDVPDYQTALNTVNESRELFETLPAEIRGRFMNDPGTLLNWLNNPNNTAEAINLGLIEKPITENKPPKTLQTDKNNTVSNENAETVSAPKAGTTNAS